MNETRPLVIYHGPGCADGFTAAWCAWKHFGDAAEYVPAQYGDPPPDVRGRDVYILDFSYPRNVTLEILQRATRLVILDHHQTAERELAPLLHLINPRLHVRFDMKKSGARLAWEFFHEGHYGQPPWLVEYVEDRDLWKFELPDSRELNAAIGSYPRTFPNWEGLAALDLGCRRILFAEGVGILRYQEELIERICKHAYPVNVVGHDVLFVNTPVLQSEAAGRLAEGRPFGVAWYAASSNLLRFSLRSTRDGVDVAEIASEMGGGGHPNAAGFEFLIDGPGRMPWGKKVG